MECAFPVSNHASTTSKTAATPNSSGANGSSAREKPCAHKNALRTSATKEPLASISGTAATSVRDLKDLQVLALLFIHRVPSPIWPNDPQAIWMNNLLSGDKRCRDGIRAGHKTHLVCFLFFQLLASRVFVLHYVTSVEESGMTATGVLQKICEHCWSRASSRSRSARDCRSKQTG